MAELSIKKDIGFDDNVVEEKLFECKSHCNFCGKVVPSEVVFVEGYTYLVKYCSCKAEKYRRLICKGKLQSPQKFSKFEKESTIEDKLIYKKGACFHLTYRCNTFCKICPNVVFGKEANDYELSSEFVKETLKNRRIKGKYIILFGGEPTVRKDLPYIIRIVKDSDNIPAITTNGIKIGEDINYLRKLKENGLRHVHLSFDGFSEGIYSKLRNSKDASFLLKKKIKALDNLQKLNMKVMLQTTLANGVNTGELIKIMDYIAANDSIFNLELKSLSLLGETKRFGFTKDNLLSSTEINELVCGALGINPEYMKLYGKLMHRFKRIISLYAFISFLNFDYPIFSMDKLYLRRVNGRLKPLLNIKEIKAILDFVEKGKISNIFQVKWSKLFFPFLKFVFQPGIIEDKFYSSKIFRVSQAMFINRNDEIIHPNYKPVNLEIVPAISTKLYPNVFGYILVVPSR